MEDPGHPRIRPPAVAGSFYPAAPEALRATVEGLLEIAERASAARPGPPPKAVIAPHAGYVYSGPVAAIAFRALAARRTPPRKVVLIGPSHRVPVRGLALPGVEMLATPLGAVPIDREGAGAALRLPQVLVQPEAHAREHSLEVELPFLQLLFPEAEVLPLVVGGASPEEVAEVLERVWGGEETVVVVSSDLSHYLPYAAARAVDAATARQVVALAGPLDPDQACGARAINGLLVAARRRGLAAELLDLRNSGDTAGPRDQVVGYGAFGFGRAA
ncbi:MAG TPA: AmmeMemoRadiSam system protein B [Thermoanaerobaculia bacterium]